MLKIAVMMTALFLSSCGQEKNSNLYVDELSESEIEKATDLGKQMVRSALSPYKDYRTKQIHASEREFFDVYGRFRKHCRLQMEIQYIRTHGYPTWSHVFMLDVRAKLTDQDEKDISHLGLRSIPYLMVPRNFSYRDRIPESKNYHRIEKIHSELRGFLSNVLRKSPGCEEGLLED